MECVTRQQIEFRNQAAIVGYPMSSADETAFRQELELARDADDGKIAREEAYNRLEQQRIKLLGRLLQYNKPPASAPVTRKP